ncbi:MAG: DUF2807 domain-containing protein, partial [Ktedonobacterales bacterium]|nr:DUF2807 domain-containing protein [Ktedonobacterales bacterium]
MRKLIAVTVPVALTLVLVGCARVGGSGSSSLKTETRTVSGFTRVTLAGNGELTIEQTGVESLTITADATILPSLTADVVDGQLTLGIKPNVSLQTSNPIRYHLTVKQLSALAITGSGDATMAKLTT